MAASHFDKNLWYTIQSHSAEGLSAVGNLTSIPLSANNASDPQQQFQFFPTGLNDHTYLIRSNGVGSNYYLGTVWRDADLTLTMTAEGAFVDNFSLLWNVTNFDTGSYFLTDYDSFYNRIVTQNSSSGSAGNSNETCLVIAPESSGGFLPSMGELDYLFDITSTNIKINDPAFSNAQLPTDAIAELKNIKTEKKPLSSGAIAGIAVGSLAGVVILCMLGFFLLDRHKRTKANRNRVLASPKEETGMVNDSQETVEAEKARE